MAQYRTLESVSYVAEGKVVSAAADRVINLNSKQAESLAGKVVALGDRNASMFPDGAPVVGTVITRDIPEPSAASEVVAPKVETKAKPPVAPKPIAPKPVVKDSGK